MILIASEESDSHAQVVGAALNVLGQPWRLLDLRRPWLSGRTIDLFAGPAAQNDLGGTAASGTRVIWWRRLPPLQLPTGSTPVDVACARAAWPHFWRGFGLIERIVQINPLSAAFAAQSKIFQLVAARRAGLGVPPTCVTNERERAADFLARQPDAVVKLLAQPASTHPGREWAGYTRPVLADMLPAAEAMRLVPVILQRRIRTAYALRVLALGRSLLAARIDAGDALDWRLSTERRTVPYAIESSLAAGLQRLLRTLGLAAASIDLVVDAENQVWFLEVNEQGQFLWLEDECPDLPVLDAFVRFLVADRPLAFRYKQGRQRLRLADFSRSASDAAGRPTA